MHVLVLGAGVTGVTTAWSLLQAGFEVDVVDRQPAAALETSFANGGQISISHPEPWSSPAAPLIALRSIGRAEAPLRLRIGLDPARWRWLAAFLRECLPARHRRNAHAIAALAVHSGERLRALREATGIEYEARTRGILHLQYTAREVTEARARLGLLAAHGIRAEVVSPQQCVDIDPALATVMPRLAGGLHAPDDESGNARLFTSALAELAAARGARFHYETTVEAIDTAGERVLGARVRDAAGKRVLAADAVVVCLGSFGPALVAPLGERLPIYPVKGYSVTAPVIDAARAPIVSLTDESRRLVASRLGETLRVAGTAEICGFDASPDASRTAPLLAWIDDLFPGACDTTQAEPWAGLRPCTPSYVPVIGRGRVDGLWFNTGHGSLGWTLSCGSADIIAALIAGRPSPVPAFPLRGDTP
ncbi:D-amino acid dehydrogenase [Pseudazoarcus pumilus]|uniref:Amino acid dehydrogenase n=1 Tax=Pseudazoarcus pumilus TaxID=2067960 RepID=A0A2I6S4D6_9RHOO|nr:D-amino acid dehydrogenase [Pseudazoarcus pumilus]AUN94126.1 amino acid dehydrogenase [Pseudazoarcus pumilus]